MESVVRKDTEDYEMNITEYIMEEIIDPTGIIQGDRYEFRIFVEVEEDDELFRAAGLGVRAIVAAENNEVRLLSSYFYERETEKALPYSLEDDEIEQVLTMCQTALQGE